RRRTVRQRVTRRSSSTRGPAPETSSFNVRPQTRCPEASSRPCHDQLVSISEPEHELSYSPGLFDWWCDDVRSRSNCTRVRRVKLSPHVDSHGDRADW